MELVSAFILIFLIGFAATIDILSDPCDQFKLQLSTIQSGFQKTLVADKERFVSELEKIFFDESTTDQEKQTQIDSVLSQSKESFETLKNKTFEKIGELIDADPKVIAMKLLHAYNIVKFPYICVLEDADSITASEKISDKYVFDYGNKLLAEL